MDRLSWRAPDGTVLEIGPFPNRKSPYLVVHGPDGLLAAAKFVGDREAEHVAALLDALTQPDQETP